MKHSAGRGFAAVGVMKKGGAPNKRDIAIYGRRSAEAALAAGRREIREMWIAEGAGGKPIERILSLALGRNIPVRRVPESALERACAGAVHQGVLLFAGPLSTPSLSDLVAHSFAHNNGEPVFVALDRVLDPQHLGAVIRLAEGLGAFMAPSGGNPMGGGRSGGGGGQAWERALAGKELFPLRVVSLDKGGKQTFRMEATAIDRKSLPDSLFAPPAGYQKFDMGGMMKGMMPPGLPGSR